MSNFKQISQMLFSGPEADLPGSAAELRASALRRGRLLIFVLLEPDYYALLPTTLPRARRHRPGPCAEEQRFKGLEDGSSGYMGRASAQLPWLW